MNRLRQVNRYEYTNIERKKENGTEKKKKTTHRVEGKEIKKRCLQNETLKKN